VLRRQLAERGDGLLAPELAQVAHTIAHRPEEAHHLALSPLLTCSDTPRATYRHGHQPREDTRAFHELQPCASERTTGGGGEGGVPWEALSGWRLSLAKVGRSSNADDDDDEGRGARRFAVADGATAPLTSDLR
jgi:hypothetical protein